MIYNSDTSAQVIGYQYDFIFHNLQLSLRDQPVAVGEIGVIIVAFNLLSQFPMCFLHKYSPPLYTRPSASVVSKWAYSNVSNGLLTKLCVPSKTVCKYRSEYIHGAKITQYTVYIGLKGIRKTCYVCISFFLVILIETLPTLPKIHLH